MEVTYICLAHMIEQNKAKGEHSCETKFATEI